MKFNTFVTRQNVAINSIHIDTHRVDLISKLSLSALIACNVMN